eukprot:6467536-Amphidinium_carterae.1
MHYGVDLQAHVAECIEVSTYPPPSPILSSEYSSISDTLPYDDTTVPSCPVCATATNGNREPITTDTLLQGGAPKSVQGSGSASKLRPKASVRRAMANTRSLAASALAEKKTTPFNMPSSPSTPSTPPLSPHNVSTPCSPSPAHASSPVDDSFEDLFIPPSHTLPPSHSTSTFYTCTSYVSRDAPFHIHYMTNTPLAGFRIHHAEGTTIATLRKALGRRLHLKLQRITLSTAINPPKGARTEVPLHDTHIIDSLGTIYMETAPSKQKTITKRPAIRTTACSTRTPSHMRKSPNHKSLKILPDGRHRIITTVTRTDVSSRIKVNTYHIDHPPNTTIQQLNRLIATDLRVAAHKLQFFITEENIVMLHPDLVVDNMGDISMTVTTSTTSTPVYKRPRCRGTVIPSPPLEQLASPAPAAPTVMTQLHTIRQQIDSLITTAPHHLPADQLLEGAGPKKEQEYETVLRTTAMNKATLLAPDITTAHQLAKAFKRIQTCLAFIKSHTTKQALHCLAAAMRRESFVYEAQALEQRAELITSNTSNHHITHQRSLPIRHPTTTAAPPPTASASNQAPQSTPAPQQTRHGHRQTESMPPPLMCSHHSHTAGPAPTNRDNAHPQPPQPIGLDPMGSSGVATTSTADGTNLHPRFPQPIGSSNTKPPGNFNDHRSHLVKYTQFKTITVITYHNFHNDWRGRPVAIKSDPRVYDREVPIPHYQAQTSTATNIVHNDNFGLQHPRPDASNSTRLAPGSSSASPAQPASYMEIAQMLQFVHHNCRQIVDTLTRHDSLLTTQQAHHERAEQTAAITTQHADTLHRHSARLESLDNAHQHLLKIAGQYTDRVEQIEHGMTSWQEQQQKTRDIMHEALHEALQATREEQAHVDRHEKLFGEQLDVNNNVMASMQHHLETISGVQKQQKDLEEQLEVNSTAVASMQHQLETLNDTQKQQHELEATVKQVFTATLELQLGYSDIRTQLAQSSACSKDDYEIMPSQPDEEDKNARDATEEEESVPSTLPYEEEIPQQQAKQATPSTPGFQSVRQAVQEWTTKPWTHKSLRSATKRAQGTEPPMAQNADADKSAKTKTRAKAKPKAEAQLKPKKPRGRPRSLPPIALMAEATTAGTDGTQHNRDIVRPEAPASVPEAQSTGKYAQNAQPNIDEQTPEPAALVPILLEDDTEDEQQPSSQPKEVSPPHQDL